MGLMHGFRALLQEELIKRCRTNPRYSLRAFARSLSVEPSALSQMINGKRPITKKMSVRLGTALGMTVQQITRVSSEDEGFSLSEAFPFQLLSLDQFAVISDWYHYAILELTYVEGFREDAAWISRRLGITKSEANIAVERLFRLKLMITDPRGKWIDNSENGNLSHIHPFQTSDGAKKYQSQILDLSKRAIQEVPIDRRNHTSVTLCFDPADLPVAVEAIKEFRRKFSKTFQPGKKAKEVYQLQVSLFPLTQETKPKRSNK